MSIQTNELDYDAVTISTVELAHIYIKGDLDPIILHRDGRTFNLKIIIEVSDVSDQTLEPKPAGT